LKPIPLTNDDQWKAAYKNYLTFPRGPNDPDNMEEFKIKYWLEFGKVACIMTMMALCGPGTFYFLLRRKMGPKLKLNSLGIIGLLGL
jgi:heme A synthase